ncbi:MAG: type II secretion system F family protein [Ruminococcaceae bacterium]|nr:type II secretion system F family protein [Oscillospiraceae bacterium]
MNMHISPTGLLPVSVQAGEIMFGKKRTSVPREELAAFCEQVALVQKSGIPLAEGIEMMQDGARGRRIEPLLAGLSDGLAKNQPLSNAMAATTGFPDYLVHMTRIGERTGNLDEIMVSLAAYYTKDAALRRKLRSALVYPAVLAVMMLAVIILIIVRVLPIFQQILHSFGGTMPGFSRVLMQFGIFLRRQWPFVLLATAIIIVLWLIFWRSSTGRRLRDRIVLNWPVVGPLYQRIYAARFSQAMASLLHSGVDLDSALNMTEAVMENSIVAKRISGLRAKIAADTDFFTALSAADIFPRLFVRLLALGNRTGELDTVMGKVADSYEAEVDAHLTRFSGIVEPLLVVLLSLIVGAILLSVMLPLVEIIGAVG